MIVPKTKTRLKIGQQWNKCTKIIDHIIGEAIRKSSNTHNLFMRYPNNTPFSAFESS